jgi:hypothetical protein
MFLLVLLLSWRTEPILADRAPDNVVTGSSLERSTSVGRNVAHQPPSSSSSVLTIYETEIFDRNKEEWIGAQPSRWSGGSGEVSSPPSKIPPPPNAQFEGDWMIVTQERDKLGWEYLYTSSNEPPKRRRIWLRTLAPMVVEKSVPVRKTRTPLLAPYGRPFTTAWQRLRDDFNFKGFGWTFYKSLLSKESFGVAFRTPLSVNFDLLDRHQQVPSVTSSVSLYYPLMAAFFLNASLNVDYLRWCFCYASSKAKHMVSLTAIALVRLFVLLLSLPLYPLTRKTFVIAPPAFPVPVSVPPPSYHLDISERIGMSVSWRVSQKRGYEFRVAYWHSYLPTMLFVQDTIRRTLRMKGSKESATSQWWKDWLRRHTGSIGTSIGGPTPDPPHYSCSACLSLSGFHYKRQKPRRQDKVESASSAAVLAEPALPSEEAKQDALEDDSSWDDQNSSGSKAVKVG